MFSLGTLQLCSKCSQQFLLPCTLSYPLITFGAHCQELIFETFFFRLFFLNLHTHSLCFIRIEHSHDSHDLQTWPGHRVLYPETVCGQQVDVIHEHEVVPLLAYAGTLDLPLHGPLLPPAYTMTPATDNQGIALALSPRLVHDLMISLTDFMFIHFLS